MAVKFPRQWLNLSLIHLAIIPDLATGARAFRLKFQKQIWYHTVAQHSNPYRYFFPGHELTLRYHDALQA